MCFFIFIHFGHFGHFGHVEHPGHHVFSDVDNFQHIVIDNHDFTVGNEKSKFDTSRIEWTVAISSSAFQRMFKNLLGTEEKRTVQRILEAWIVTC